MPSERNVYEVSYSAPDGAKQVTTHTALVRATNGARAERHVARELLSIKAKYAEQNRIIELVGAGTKVVDAKEAE